MDDLTRYLGTLGTGVASNALWAALRSVATKMGETFSRESLADEIRGTTGLTLERAQVVADRAIEFWARNGDITVSGSSIHASRSITMASAPGTHVSYGDGSTSSTDKTRIDAGPGARIVMTGGAQIRQEEDGSITFWT